VEIDVLWRLVLLFFLFWGLVFFASSEASLFSLGRFRLHKLKKENHPRYLVIEGLLARPRQLISSLLIGNEAVNVAISSLTTAVLIAIWGDIAKWIAIPVVVFLILLFGEVIPKTLSVHHPERVAPLVAAPVRKFVDGVWPIHALIQKVVDLALRWTGGKSDASSSALMEKDFRDLVETGHQEGTLEESEKRLIHRVFQFGDQTAKSIMTPRSAIFALPLHARPGEILEALRQNHFSRIPVFKKDLDEIAGVFHVKDLLRTRGQGKKIEEAGLRSLMRAPYFVPVSKKLDDLLKEFQKRRIHLAIVVDEYGKTAGVVTLEDILEELFGEIMDDLDIKRRADRRKERTRTPSPPPTYSGSSRPEEVVP
jgi:CBS domain containing-hemolysin-like protein